MRDKIIDLIKILGFGLTEIVIDIEISIGIFNTIEWDELDNKIYLHIFKDNLDISIDFDDLSKDDKLKIYKVLSIFYN